MLNSLRLLKLRRDKHIFVFINTHFILLVELSAASVKGRVKEATVLDNLDDKPKNAKEGVACNVLAFTEGQKAHRMRVIFKI